MSQSASCQEIFNFVYILQLTARMVLNIEELYSGQRQALPVRTGICRHHTSILTLLKGFRMRDL